MKQILKRSFIILKMPTIFTICAILFISLSIIYLPLQVTFAEEVSPKSVVYVEVNNEEFKNVANYTLEGTNKPAFDIGIIFAANINYNTKDKKAYLYLNQQVTQTLENSKSQILPVQARGTKVMLSILGNHQGAGFANFTNYEQAENFAKEIEQVVTKYHLDGVDFDDEYAEYGKNNTPQPNASSFIWLLEALRAHLGKDKLITLYDIGPTARLSSSNPKLSELIDYAWNPYYGTWSPPQFSGMARSRLGAASVEIGVNESQAVHLAKQTISEGYGIYLMYNLKNVNESSYLSSITNQLYGRKTIYSPIASDHQ